MLFEEFEKWKQEYASKLNLATDEEIFGIFYQDKNDCEGFCEMLTDLAYEIVQMQIRLEGIHEEKIKGKQMIKQISISGTDKKELELAHYIIEMFVMPFFDSEDFEILKKIFEEQEWTSKSETSKKPSKKTPPKKKANSPALKKPIKKETNLSMQAKKPKKAARSK